MNTIKKTVSVLLAVMMIFSMLTIVSVSAAETSKITVESNLCDAVQYDYNENASQVTVTYNLQSDKMILNAQGTLNYDGSVLKLASTTTPKTILPILSNGSSVANLGMKNMIKFNATSLDLYDFTKGGVFFTATFDIIGSGNTTVDLDVEVITATEAKNYDDVAAGAKDIDLVYFGEIKSNDFTFSSKADVKSNVVASNVSVFGDIALDLETEDGVVYTGKTDLEAGTYKFNVNNNGTTHGMNFTYQDTATIDYSQGFKAQSTLKASGGRYTFAFNTATKKLTIAYKPFNEIVELVGDINVELVNPKKTSTVFTGTVRLDKGTYKFNVNEHGKTFGLNYEFTDVIYNKEFIWTAAATFNATGGVYSISYDTSNNVLKVMHAPAGLGDVTVFGDISLPLANQGKGIYSAVTVLEAGKYGIRVDSFGTIYGCGSQFSNTINTEFKTEWKASAELTVTSKMKFTFVFDTNTNKVKVFNSAIDTSKVLVAFENSNLELQKNSDGVTYSATTTLAAGTYTFRIDEFGVTMGYGGSATDSITDLKYDASYQSATTFTATGGNYKFSFNTYSNRLTVKKV